MGPILEIEPILGILVCVFEQNTNSVFDLMSLILEMGLILERSYIRTYTVRLLVSISTPMDQISTEYFTR